MIRRARLAGALALALASQGCRKAPPLATPSAAKVDELQQILASRNDNDPRLDTDFNALTDREKQVFRDAYAALPREKRNERGTIVYLLGKNLSEDADWAFLSAVAGEPPCLSLSDCEKPAAGPAEPGDAVTLAYPALVALKAAERALDAGKDAGPARAVVEAGLASKAPAARRLAQRLAAKK